MIDISAHNEFRKELQTVLGDIEKMLAEKNMKYGDAALNPKRIFSKSGHIEQLNVRIDDKLSRIANRTDEEDEDVEMDLIGYLILKQIAKKHK